MKITKEYEGITRKENGDYYISGSIETDEDIEIELDDRLEVGGSIASEKSIISNTTIISRDNIEAGRYINVGCGIEAGWGIKAGDGIEAGYGIKAGWDVYAQTYIDCGLRIFAGTSINDSEATAKKTISCAELRNGQIAYGELVITGDGGKERKEK